ncbi:MAG: response regulator [Candidatus Krumholzibacteriia bacterium]
MSEITRVLVVDDEEELTSTLTERLHFRGFPAEGVTSGAAALARLEQDDFDVVVLDVKMPGLGGLEVIERIKARRPEVQVILLTGHSSARSAEDGLNLGAFEYVLKPVKIDILVDMIQRAAGRRRDGRP